MSHSISTDPSTSTTVLSYHQLQVQTPSTHAVQDPRFKRRLPRPSTAPDKEDCVLLPAFPLTKEAIMNDHDTLRPSLESEPGTMGAGAALRPSSQRDGVAGNLTLGVS